MVDNLSLYVANPNGENIQKIYTVDEKSLIAAWWLSDVIILFEVYPYDENGHIWPPPHQYYFDISNGTTGRVDPGNTTDESGTYLVQGVALLHKDEWVQANAIDGSVEVADINGKHKTLLQEYKVTYLVASTSVEFIPGTDEFVFLASQADSLAFWRSSLSDKSATLIADEAQVGQIVQAYHVSPDGKYFAFVHEKGIAYALAIYDFQTGKIIHDWDFPCGPTTPSFVWSPNSEEIAFEYANFKDQNKGGDAFGIQLIQVFSGNLSPLVSGDDFIRIHSWQFASPSK